MAENATRTAPPAASAPDRVRGEVSLTRLYVLRAAYALLVIPTLVMAALSSGPLAKLVFHPPTERGMINGIQVGLFVMAAIGLRHPLRMLPILLLEFTWKTVWLLAYGLPQWLVGLRSPQLSEDMILIGCGPILFGLVIPWTYAFRYYLRQPSERWR